MNRSDRLRDLQILAILVPALCAGIYETLRHSVLSSDLPFDLGTPVAVAIVLAISYGFAKVSFGMIRRTEAVGIASGDDPSSMPPSRISRRLPRCGCCASPRRR